MSTELNGAPAPTNSAPPSQGNPPAAPPSQSMPPATGVLHPSQVAMPGHVIAPTQPASQQGQGQQQAKTYSDDAIVNAIVRATGRTPEFVRDYIATKGNGDAMAVFETAMRDAVGTLTAQEQAASQVPTTQTAPSTTGIPGVGADGRIKLPDGWNAAVRQVDRGGKMVYEPVLPEYQNIANAANHNQLVDQEQAAVWQRNPAEAIRNDPTIKEMIRQEAEALFKQQSQQQRAVQLREKYREKHKEAYELDQNGNIRYDLNGKPTLTPLGRAYYRIGNEMMKSGYGEDESLYERSWILARNEVGVQQAAANMTGAPMNQNTFGMGAQPNYQPQQGQPYYPVGAVLQNAQTLFPAGNAQAQPQGGDMTLEGALWQGIADAPEDQSAGFYMEHLSQGTKNWGTPPAMRR